MPDYNVHIANPACKEIKKLTKSARIQVMDSIDALHTDPWPTGVEKLKSRPSYFRIRSGNFRIIYSAQQRPKRLVVVLVVRDRKDAFKGLDELDRKLASALTMVADSILEMSPTVGSA